jgi:hypothetical protein
MFSRRTGARGRASLIYRNPLKIRAVKPALILVGCKPSKVYGNYLFVV